MIETVRVRAVDRHVTVEGWTEVRITRRLGSCASTFEIGIPGAVRVPLTPDDLVEVCVGPESSGDEVVARGYIFGVDRSRGDSGTVTRFSGRESTADLVDCSIPGVSSWTNATLATIVESIAGQYGVAVVDALKDERRFELFRARPGETCWSAIDRAARLRGALIGGTGYGDLRIMRPEEKKFSAQLFEGAYGGEEQPLYPGSVISTRLRASAEERFRHYIVRGQRGGSDLVYGGAAAHVEGVATDSRISRNRTLIVVAEGSVDQATATERARWEATVRAARAVGISNVVKGWRQPFAVNQFGPQIWRVGSLVSLRLPSVGFSGTMLLDGMQLLQDPTSGTRSVLEFVRPDTYQPEPILPGNADLLGTFDEEADAAESDVEGEGE